MRSLPLWCALSACSPARASEQTALVMAPEMPIAFGAALPEQASSVTLSAGATAVRGGVDQHVLPLASQLRATHWVAPGLELAAQGSLGPDLTLPGLAPGVPGLRGVLGRTTLGLRLMAPLESAEWGFTLDAGGEATYLGYPLFGGRYLHRIRVIPHLRVGTLLRIPLPAGLSVMGGLQTQTWPLYAPTSRVMAVFTPTAGLSLRTGALSVHTQAFVHGGSSAVQAVPWGASVALEVTSGARAGRDR